MDEDGCEQCGSTTFRVEDGLTYCENGHEQARGAVVAEDDQDFARTGNIVRKKRVREKQKISRVLHGVKAYQLFLQSWQFILWKQCHALVHQKGLPPELWTIVRDLWTLWLSRLESRLQDAHDLPDAADKGDTTASSGNDTGTDVDTDRESQSPTRRNTRDKGPTLVDTISLNYLGIVLLRRPIGLATILRWIKGEDIPFIRAIRHVPQEMKDRLPGTYHSSLDSIRNLGPDSLQQAVYRRVQMYHSSFGISFPPLNHKLCLLDYTRRLSLPIEVFSIVGRLNEVLKFDFQYPDFTTASEASRRHSTTYPEAQLMSLLVVATKLLFPFDSETVKRYPKSANDATTLLMDWTAWLEANASSENISETGLDLNGFEPGSEMNVTDRDVLEMTGEQLDHYMDWYQRTWINGNPSQTQQSQERGLDKDILDMFPLHDVPEVAKTREHATQAKEEENSRLAERVRRVQASLASRRAISTEEETERDLDVPRPGMGYLRFRKVGDLERAGEAARIFHEEAARTACLSVKTLLLAVTRTEEKIELWLRDRRREAAFADEGEQEEGVEVEVEEPEGEIGPATSPPSKLAGDLGGLDIGHSPAKPDEEQSDTDVAMEMLSNI